MMLLVSPLMAQELLKSATTAAYKIPVPSGMELVKEPQSLAAYRNSSQGAYTRSSSKATIDGVLRFTGDKDFKKGSMFFSWYPVAGDLDLSSREKTKQGVEMVTAVVFSGFDAEPKDAKWMTLGGIDFFWAIANPARSPKTTLQMLLGINSKTRRAYQIVGIAPTPTAAKAFTDAIPRIVPR